MAPRARIFLAARKHPGFLLTSEASMYRKPATIRGYARELVGSVMRGSSYSLWPCRRFHVISPTHGRLPSGTGP